MSLLIEGMEKQSVIKTENNKKVTIDGHTENYSVYKIKLDELYYNDQNDRIATWISQYKLENNLDKIDLSDKTKYNDIIHNFITKSSPETLRKTQANIKLIGQQVHGVVLDDGRIIDGNRRFSCLRNIEKETHDIQYFEAVILKRDIKSNAKQIKILELQLQYVDKTVDYSPIDRLVGIYNYIIKDKGLLTITEYAKSVNLTEKEIEKEVEKANLMIEFLEFMKTQGQFHLLREMELYYPLEELYKNLKKIRYEDIKEKIKTNAFVNFMVNPFGDMTRYMRKRNKITNNSKLVDDYIEEQMNTVEIVCNIIEKHDSMNINIIRDEIRSRDDIKDVLFRSTEKWEAKVNSQTNKNQPALLADKAIGMLEDIDINIFNKLTDEQKQDVYNKIQELEELIEGIKNKLNV